MNEEKCSVEVFSRVTGFYRPVQSWNKGKTQEFSDRLRFELEKPSAKVFSLSGNSCMGCEK